MTAEHSIHARFGAGLAQSARRPAIRIGERAWTYQQVHDLALTWAEKILEATGSDRLRPARVGLLCGRGPEAYVGILATLYAGATVAPLLADFPADRTASMVEDLEPDLVLLDPAGEKVWPQVGSSAPTMTTGKIPEHVEVRARLKEPVWREAYDDAYVLFTSGSTGRPKGVRLTHGNLLTYFAHTDAEYGWGAHDVFAQAANLNWDSSVSDVWSAWGVGAPLVPIPAHAYRNLPAFINVHGITVWFSAPSVVGLVRRTGNLAPGCMPWLTHIIFGGEALLCSDTAEWQAAAPKAQIINVYGPTETTITTQRHTWTPGVSDVQAVNGIVPIGAAHPEVTELLVPLDDGAWNTGELWLGGAQVSAGYVRPEQEQGRYVERDGQIWYRTGDVVRRLPSGELAFLGRIDNQVQIHGLRVELGDIEHALRAVPGVQEVVVVGVPSDGTTQLRVFYTGNEVAAVDFNRTLQRSLPTQLIPRWYRRVPEFPLNANRKIDRKELQLQASGS